MQFPQQTDETPFLHVTNNLKGKASFFLNTCQKSRQGMKVEYHAL